MTTTQQRPAAAQRRPRPPGRRGRGGSAVLNLVIGLAFAGGAIGLQSSALTSDDMNAPLMYAGDKGEVVDAGRFSVKVDSLESAKAIKVKTATVETDQIFLVINVSATVPKQPIHLGLPSLATEDGRTFAATDRVERSATLANPWIQPGWWSTGQYVFEVPASVLQGARAVFEEHVGIVGALYGDPVTPAAIVDLGIDEALAKRLASAPKDVYTLGGKQ